VQVTASAVSMAESSNAASKNVDADLEELDRLLNREASALQRDLEVERILKAFKLNPYEILDIRTNATAEEIKKRYRHLSLYIHPDKATHPKASEAFDLLKKAEAELSEPKKREEIDAVIAQARTLLLKDHSLPTSIADDDSRLAKLQPRFKEQLRLRVKDLLIEEEVRRRKYVS